ncbi:MAG: outer membrane beta-barrel protein [Vicinamibacteria bacterium]|nr:outer membrane beta-barrel protein [Vicinamibacteria bacterium]
MINTTSRIRQLALAAVTMGFLASPREAGAIERTGFIAGLGVGGGKITCDGCESLSGPAIAFHLGGMITDRAALVFDGSGVAKYEEGTTLTSVLATAALQYWVSPKVWVKGGVGAGQLGVSGKGVSETSDMGLGFLGGIGIEAIQKKRFTIDLQMRVTTAKIEGERATNVFALVGFNFY